MVLQHSDKTVINWNGFSIEGDEVTRFVQPGRNSIALNRVVFLTTTADIADDNFMGVVVIFKVIE